MLAKQWFSCQVENMLRWCTAISSQMRRSWWSLSQISLPTAERSWFVVVLLAFDHAKTLYSSFFSLTFDSLQDKSVSKYKYRFFLYCDVSLLSGLPVSARFATYIYRFVYSWLQNRCRVQNDKTYRLRSKDFWEISETYIMHIWYTFLNTV
jgi:hypothetical protein